MHSLHTLDIVILLALIIFFIIGWWKGLLQILIGPLSLALGLLITFIYYKLTHQLLPSLIIAIVSPFFIHIIFSLLFAIFKKGKDKKNPNKELPVFDQIGGAVFSTLWGGFLIASILISITIIPNSHPSLLKIQKQIKQCFLYDIANTLSNKKFERMENNMDKFLTKIEDPDVVKKMVSSDAFQNILNEEKIKDLREDPKILEDIKNRNFKEITSNPKVQAVLNDPQLMKKVMEIQKNILNGELSDEK